MRELLLFIVVLLSALSFSSCGDDERVFMQWEVVNDAKNDIKITDDPMMYVQVTVTANEKGGNVVLTCTNMGTIGTSRISGA